MFLRSAMSWYILWIGEDVRVISNSCVLWLSISEQKAALTGHGNRAKVSAIKSIPMQLHSDPNVKMPVSTSLERAGTLDCSMALESSVARMFPSWVLWVDAVSFIAVFACFRLTVPLLLWTCFAVLFLSAMVVVIRCECDGLGPSSSNRKSILATRKRLHGLKPRC